jgi:hypothetical protein
MIKMVSISKRTEPCCICGKTGTRGVFGRYYCKECYEKRPKRGKGHGGLVALPEKELQHILGGKYPYREKPYLHPVTKGNKVFASLYLSHYPASKGMVGRSICYLIYYQESIYGIIGLLNPPYAVAAIDEFFGINKENRNEKNLHIANNHVFRLLYEEPNLASQCLRLLRKVGARDWERKYGIKLDGILTFVEPPRKGICYIADNWLYLGMTKGFGTTQRSKRWEKRQWVKKVPKHIFAVKL